MPEFNPLRLSVALRRRGVQRARFCKQVGISTRALLAFERGEKKPSDETLARIAGALAFAVEFFHRDDPPAFAVDAASFRALSSMTVSKRAQALAAGELAADLARWIDARFDLPLLDVPRLPHIDPETAADLIRTEWDLGERPIGNMIHLAESHGVRVFSISDDYADVNAFSLWQGDTPYMFLNTEKSAESGRFDVAHELGHLVLHGHHEAPRGRDYEREANRFASAFLMPRRSIKASGLMNASIEALVRAKRQWGVSVMALIMRLNETGLTTEWHHRSLCIEAAKRGYRKQEPQGLQRETSQVLGKVFAALRDEGINRADVARQLGIEPADLDRLIFGLVLTSVPGESDASRSRPDTGRPGLRLVPESQ